MLGTPAWVSTWTLVQVALTDPQERNSSLRLGVLYLLTLSGVITVLTTAAMTLHTLLDVLLGVRLSASDVVNKIGGPRSIGIPLAVVWRYHGHWLQRHIESVAEPARRGGMRRIYAYILSAVGLGGTVLGVAQLMYFIISLLTGGALVMDDTLRTALGRALAVIAARQDWPCCSSTTSRTSARWPAGCANPCITGFLLKVSLLFKIMLYFQ